MGNVFPKEPLARLPVTHPVFRAGFDLERLDYTPAVTRGGQPPDSIRLEGIPIEGRVAIVYSSYDLGCAIDGHCTPDCHGLRRDSALNVAANVVIYALGF
jgi:hypothetical protein